MIILDTDAVSELMRPRPAPGLLSRLAEVPVNQQATTAITMGELAYAAHKAKRPDLYERAIRLLAGVRVLDFDIPAAQRYGRVRAGLERAGRRIADPELRIAAVALAHAATLVTGNLQHFARVPELTAEDWIHPGR